MNKNDVLICKKLPELGNRTGIYENYYKLNQPYIIHGFDGYKVKVEIYFFTLKPLKKKYPLIIPEPLYLWDYFYTLKEHRKEKIKKLKWRKL
jgi:hypothetical protein